MERFEFVFLFLGLLKSILSGNLNSVIGDISFLVSQQKATYSSIIYFTFEPCHLLHNTSFHIMIQTHKL